MVHRELLRAVEPKWCNCVVDFEAPNWMNVWVGDAGEARVNTAIRSGAWAGESGLCDRVIF
jgi:hypothetical protein